MNCAIDLLCSDHTTVNIARRPVEYYSNLFVLSPLLAKAEVLWKNSILVTTNFQCHTLIFLVIFFPLSDSDENARKEIGIFFPEFDVDSWYENQEQLYRTGNIEYCSQSGIHVIDPGNRWQGLGSGMENLPHVTAVFSLLVQALSFEACRCDSTLSHT